MLSSMLAVIYSSELLSSSILRWALTAFATFTLTIRGDFGPDSFELVCFISLFKFLVLNCVGRKNGFSLELPKNKEKNVKVRKERG